LRREDFQSYKDCSTILHLAGINRTGPSYLEQKSMLDVNITGTLNALHFSQMNGIRFLFASTCCYGNTAVLPISEKEPITYHDPYSFSKWHVEQAISAWHRFFGLEGAIFRIFNVYGPEQPGGFLIPDIASKIREGRTSFPNLTSVRDFIYVDDLAELISIAIQKPSKGLLTVNAGAGSGNSVREVIDTIFDLLGMQVSLVDEGRPAFIKKSIADISLAKKLFGWTPKTGLKEGLSLLLKARA